MARWMVLYRDENSEPKCAIVNDSNDCNLPFGVTAENVVHDLPDYNSGAGAFIMALPDEGEPDVYDLESDSEIGRQFIDL